MPASYQPRATLPCSVGSTLNYPHDTHLWPAVEDFAVRECKWENGAKFRYWCQPGSRRSDQKTKTSGVPPFAPYLASSGVCVGGGFIGLRWVTHEHLDASCNLGIPEVVKNFELAQDSLILMDAQRAPVRQLRHRFGPRRTPLFPSPHVPCGMFYLLPHADRVLTAGLAIRCSDVLIGC